MPTRAHFQFIQKLKKEKELIKSGKFEILRFTEFSGRFLCVHDRTEGLTLYEWVRQDDITRAGIIRVMEDVAEALRSYSLTSEIKPYNMVNPHTIIISGKGEAFLLDKQDEYYSKMKVKMLTGSMKENYIDAYKRVCAVKQKLSLKEEVFGYGVTLKFIIASTQDKLRLKRREIRGFVKLINKCTTSGDEKYLGIINVLRDLRKITDEEYFRQRKKTTEVIILSVCLLVILSLFVQVIL